MLLQLWHRLQLQLSPGNVQCPGGSKKKKKKKVHLFFSLAMCLIAIHSSLRGKVRGLSLHSKLETRIPITYPARSHWSIDD